VAKPSGGDTRLAALFFGSPLNLFSGRQTQSNYPGMIRSPPQNRRRDTWRLFFDRPDAMCGQILKLSISLAAIATSAVSLLAISWIGLAFLGF
jgi:hypothetical protein